MDNKLKALYVVKPHGLVFTSTGQLINYVITIYEKTLACNFRAYYVSTNIFFPNSGQHESDERMFLWSNKALVIGYLKRLRVLMAPHSLDILDLRKTRVEKEQYEGIVEAWNESTN